MKLFEQLRKNIHLNKSWEKKDKKLGYTHIRGIKKEFYDGLIRDLMKHKAFVLAEIVMDEKLKEKFDINIADELIGLNVFSAQKKFDMYKEKFDILIDKESEFDFNQQLSQQLGSTLMTFDTDEFKNDRLRLSDQIRKRMEDDAIQYTGQLFHDMIYVYTESQQWADCAKLLRMQQDRR